jgi:hypothetical protein
MRSIIVLAALGAAIAGAPALAESPLEGTWHTSTASAQGAREATMTVAATADGGYEITFVPMGPPPGGAGGGGAGAPGGFQSTISDVVVDGASFSFKRSLTTPQGAIEITYAGTVEGDTLTGTANSSFGENAFSGARQ